MHVIPSRRVAVALAAPPDPVELSIRLVLEGESTTRRVVRVANLQGGHVNRRQLKRLRVSKAVIDGWVKTGWLILVHRGVYAVGHLPRSHESRWWGCVLACGHRSKLSAGTSAAKHGLLEPHRRVHVTTPSKRSRPGIANHTADTKTVWIDGLPCTTVARTLLDLAGSVPHATLERACRQAQTRGVLDLDELGRLMLAFPRARGVRRLRAILGNPVAMAPTRSAPERTALRSLLDAGFPWPAVGERVHGEELDLYLPGLRVGVEIDGPTHSTQVQGERDRRRDEKLLAFGITILRIPDTDAASAGAALRRLVDSPAHTRSIDDSTGRRRDAEAA